MKPAAAGLAALLGLMGCGPGGGSCPRPSAVPLPMTEARAKAIDPLAAAGIAVSTTEIRGDCRTTTATVPVCGALCARRRAPFQVWAVPANVSVPTRPACGPTPAELDGLTPHRGTASAEGELVLALAPGRYSLYLALDGDCAACGLERDGAGCTVDVQPGTLSVRDLVLDRATH